MAVTLNHTIIHARDKEATATFLTQIMGLAPHRRLAHFAVVQVGDTSLDLIETDEKIVSRHFAFKVSEAEFDEILARIRQRGLFSTGPIRFTANPARSITGTTAGASISKIRTATFLRSSRVPMAAAAPTRSTRTLFCRDEVRGTGTCLNSNRCSADECRRAAASWERGHLARVCGPKKKRAGGTPALPGHAAIRPSSRS